MAFVDNRYCVATAIYVYHAHTTPLSVEWHRRILDWNRITSGKTARTGSQARGGIEIIEKGAS
jgi:hypothetical protein